MESGENFGFEVSHPTLTPITKLSYAHLSELVSVIVRRHNQPIENCTKGLQHKSNLGKMLEIIL